MKSDFSHVSDIGNLGAAQVECCKMPEEQKERWRGTFKTQIIELKPLS